MKIPSTVPKNDEKPAFNKKGDKQRLTFHAVHSDEINYCKNPKYIDTKAKCNLCRKCLHKH